MSTSLRVYVYSSGSTLVSDPDREMERIERIQFATLYPGGLYGTASMYVPRDVVRSWALKGGQRLVIRNGLKIVFEGRIVNLPKSIESDGQGIAIHAVGYWGDVLMQRRLRKPWADRRLSADVWVEPLTAYTGNDKTLLQMCTVDRLNRIRITPKAVAFSASWYHRIAYSTPTGQTIKRITFNYDMQEAAQAWQMELWNQVAGLQWSVVASGTGTADVSPASPESTMFFLFRSGAAQTPPANGTVYAEISNVVVYTETGAINPTEIAKDVAGYCSDLSADPSLIGSNTLSLMPFVTDEIGRFPSLAEILTHACRFGDASYNPWAAGVRASDLSSDGLPVMFLEQYPALTDYDYAVSIGDANLMPPVSIEQDFSELKNYVIVTYRNEQGYEVDVTPDDDATLNDTTSISNYGQREHYLRVDTASATTAANYGRRYLAEHKGQQWRVNGDLRLKGYVKAKSGVSVPACEVQAGKRIKVSNFIQDLSGTGLTFLIKGTQYTDTDQSVSLSVGNVDRVEVLLAQLMAGKRTI